MNDDKDFKQLFDNKAQAVRAFERLERKYLKELEHRHYLLQLCIENGLIENI